VTTELRNYRIRRGKLDQFIREWREGIVPLREALGYRIEAAWTVPSESRFIWLLSRDIPASQWDAANDAYYADPRRATMDPDPARLIVSQRHYLLEPIEPAPA
jgi:hypothetical protein